VLVAPSDTVPPKWRKKLMLAFMGKYRDLVQDRIGSRVGDTVWDVADGFMKASLSLSLTITIVISRS
jgi:nucleolar protein 9